MCESKSHTRKRLAAARRNGEPIDARHLLRRMQAVVADLLAQLCDALCLFFLWYGEARNLIFQLCRKLRPKGLRLPYACQTVAQFKLRAVQAVCIHKHTKKKFDDHPPREKIYFIRLLFLYLLIQRGQLINSLCKKVIQFLFRDNIFKKISKVNTRQYVRFIHPM